MKKLVFLFVALIAMQFVVSCKDSQTKSTDSSADTIMDPCDSLCAGPEDTVKAI